MSNAMIENADDIKCTLKFTRSLKEWKEIRSTLNENPCYSETQIISEINDLIYQLEKTLFANVEQPND